MTPADLRVQMGFLRIAERFEERKVIENPLSGKREIGYELSESGPAMPLEDSRFPITGRARLYS